MSGVIAYTFGMFWKLEELEELEEYVPIVSGFVSGDEDERQRGERENTFLLNLCFDSTKFYNRVLVFKER
jgi:hypothetical protein